VGAGHAIKNAVTSPATAVGNYISNNAYKNIQKESVGKEPVESPCWVTKKSVLPMLSDIEKLTNAVRENVCSCVPFGSCSVDECPCSRLCPKGFEIFKRPGVESTADLSTTSNSLSFTNMSGGGDIKATQGFCWGHASVTSKFNRLAFFKKKDKPKHDIYSNDRNEQKKALSYYKSLIDEVVDNKVVSIPGIANLNELSSIPGLQSYISDKVAHEWAKRAMTAGGLKLGLRTKVMKRRESETLFRDIKDKLKHNQQPQIIFTKRGNAMKTHAVLVSHTMKHPDGRDILCIRDNNRSRLAMSAIKTSCIDKMIIDKDGGINYLNPDWGELGGVEIGFNDNPDALAQIKSLKEQCDRDKSCGN
jgi:hypothetical protein